MKEKEDGIQIRGNGSMVALYWRALARYPGYMPVREAAGARPLHLALAGRGCGDDHARPARLPPGGDRLAGAAADLAAASGGLSEPLGAAV